MAAKLTSTTPTPPNGKSLLFMFTTEPLGFNQTYISTIQALPRGTRVLSF